MHLRFVLTFPGRGLDEAQRLADRIERDWRIDAHAVSIAEVAASQWETSAYFASEEQAHLAREALGGNAAIAPLPEIDWVVSSLADLSPVEAGRFFIHGSHDRGRRRFGGISIEIDASTAFGSGHHATTRGCLLAFDRLLKRRSPRRVLDLGCGSGILAIAAAKATRRPIVACDIDTEAVAVTRYNARSNGVMSGIRAVVANGLKHRSIHAGAPYGLIFANILAGPLVCLAYGLSRLLSPGGRLILSGLTGDQIRWVRAIYRNHGLVVERTLIENGWATLLLRRRLPMQ